MKYYLMHKNIIVAQIDIDYNGNLSHVMLNKNNIEHLPLGCQMNNMKFHEWWNNRAVPKTRKGSNHALRELGLQSTNSMLVNNLALSLNDCYWIKPIDSELCWEHVNLFRNNFIDIFGELTFDTTKSLSKELKNTKFMYATSQGELQKKWCISNYDGRRFLVKGNWGESYQQSINEVFASEIHKKQGYTKYTPYRLVRVNTEDNGSELGCYSYNFCNENVEFVSALEVLQTVNMKQNESWFYKFKQVCVEKLGLNEEYFDKFMSYMICTDFIMSNTDRNMNNIGLLRNPVTLEFIGFAPIYDTGNSMFFRNREIPTGNLLKIETHSFLKREVDLLKYVTHRYIVNIQYLPDKDDFEDMYRQDIVERHGRIEPMYNAYIQKIHYLDKFQSGDNIWKIR